MQAQFYKYRYTTTTGEEPRLLPDLEAEEIIARPNVSESFETSAAAPLGLPLFTRAWEVYEPGERPEDYPDGDPNADRVEMAPEGYCWTQDARYVEPTHHPVAVVAAYENQLEEVETLEPVATLEEAIQAAKGAGYEVAPGGCETTSAWDESRGKVHVVTISPMMDIVEAVEHIQRTRGRVVAHDEAGQYDVSIYEDGGRLRVSFGRRGTSISASRDFQEEDYRALADLRFKGRANV